MWGLMNNHTAAGKGETGGDTEFVGSPSFTVEGDGTNIALSLHSNSDIDFEEIGIDSMISPGELAADEIRMLLHQSAFNDTIEFEDGVLNILGSTLEYNSPLINLTVEESIKKFPNVDFITIAVKPKNSDKTIIPRGDTVFHSNDQVYFSTPARPGP